MLINEVMASTNEKRRWQQDVRIERRYLKYWELSVTYLWLQRSQ